MVTPLELADQLEEAAHWVRSERLGNTLMIAAANMRRLHHEREELINALRCIAGTSAQAAGTGDHWVHWVDQAKAAITKVVDAS